MNKKQLSDFTVQKIDHLSKDTFIITLKCDQLLPSVLPGQFAELEVIGSYEVFLRRPFSVHYIDYDNRTLSFYVKIIGKGTNRIAKLQKGEKVSVMFPLGNHFTLLQTGRVLLVGGGSGVAPMLILAEHLKRAGAHPVMILGGRSAMDIHASEKYFQSAEMHFTTEDGSKGVKGFVTDHPEINKRFNFERVYTCGPEPMMKAIASISKSHNTPCEVSLENTMACGFGACLCCIVKTVDGNKCVCTEGPVFNTSTLEGW